MEYLLLIVAIAVVIYFAIGRSKATKHKQANQRALKMPNESVWLEERWALTASHRQSGNRSMFPDWYYDDLESLVSSQIGRSPRDKHPI
jgi:hypothetical protein